MNPRFSVASAFVQLPLLIAALTFGAACSNPDPGTTTGFKCPDDIAAAKNSDFCADAPSTIDCKRVTPGQKNQVCGIALRSPNADLERSTSVKKYSGSGPVDLSCFAAGSYPAPLETPQMVTLTGVAEIFSHGCESSDLTIEVWTVKRTGGADDGEPGTLVGAAVTTPADCKAAALATTDDECGTRYECNFSYPSVPTETELLI